MASFDISNGQAAGAADDDDMLLLRDPLSNKGFSYSYSKLLVKYPVPIFILLIVVTSAMGGVSLFVYDMPVFDDATKGFEARGVVYTNRIAANELLHRDPRLSKQPRLHTGGEDNSNVVMSQDYDDYESNVVSMTSYVNQTEYPDATYTERVIKRQVAESHNWFCSSQHEKIYVERMVFTPASHTDHSLFNIRAIQSMCSLQKSILKTFADDSPDLQKFSQPYNEDYQCQNTWSILNVLTDIGNRTSCDDVTNDDLYALRDLLHECAPFYENGSLTCEDDSCHANVPDKCLHNDRVVNVLLYLTPSSFTQESKEKTFNLKSTLMFVFISWSDREDFFARNFEHSVVSDGVTKVDALYLNGLKYVLSNRYLESDALYVGLGAAMAVFIIGLYTGSLFITLMTIINMVMSLVVAYFFYRVVFQLVFFPFVNVLAVVLLLGIGADDTFVFMDIWKKSKEKNAGKDRIVILHETIGHAAMTMFVTSFTTGSALYANVISSIISVKLFAVYSGTAILANFIFTITWLPVVVVMDDWCSEHCCGWLKSEGRANQRMLKTLTDVSDKLISYYFLNFVFKLRLLWIAVLGIVGAAGAYFIFVSPTLQLPSSTDVPLFKSDHPLEKYSHYKGQYDFENIDVDLLPYIVVFGIHPYDDRSTWDPDAKSTKNVTFVDNFDVSDPDSQSWLFNFCKDIRDQPFIKHDREIQCFIEDIKERIETPCSANAIPNMCCNRTDFPFPKSVFQVCAPIVCKYPTCGSSMYGPLFSGENNTILAFSVAATSTTYKVPIYENTRKFWTAADEWTSAQLEKAPRSIQGGWFITTGWFQMLYALQRGLAIGTTQSMAMSLGIAALVLFLTTRNILTSIYAIVSVVGTVFVTIGSLVLLGWQLNVTECVILSIAVGLSVDFTIHYGVAYRIAPVTDRKGRSEFAIHTLGSAVMVAAISTFSVGAMMMPSEVLIYPQLGIFMMLVMSTSWVYANFFFLSLCRTIGPSRDFAQIPFPNCSVCTEKTDAALQLDNDYVHSTGDSWSNHENVEMAAPGTIQFRLNP